MLRLINPPFRLLLYLEWLLLATTLLIEVLRPFESYWWLFWEAGAIGLFLLMGLLLPTGKLAIRVVYTALEIGLIWFSATQSGLYPRSAFLMFLVLVMRSCLIFKPVKQLIVLGLSLYFYGILLLSRSNLHEKYKIYALDWRFGNLLLFSITLSLTVLLINALLAERQSREQLEIAHQQLEITNQKLRHYALIIEDQATLQERNRIAREIHDGLGHTLAAQTIQINNALLFWESNSDKALTFLKQTKQLGAEALLEIRRSLAVLRSDPLQGQSLKSAVEKLLRDFEQTTGIKPLCQIDLPISLPTEVNRTLYRLVQESLTNISKHAEATKVVVVILAHGQMINLSIQDNGKGFNPTQNTTGFGLQGMQERASALGVGGRLKIESQPGNGCCISFSLPLSKLWF